MSPASTETPITVTGNASAKAGLVAARFLRRLNRFAALVDLEGHETLVHVANSGRMRELLVVGNVC